MTRTKLFPVNLGVFVNEAWCPNPLNSFMLSVEAKSLHYAPPAFAFCPRRLFVMIRAVIIFLKGINRVVFIIDTVYCEGRN